MELVEKKLLDRQLENNFGKILDKKIYPYLANGWFRNSVSLDLQYQGIDLWLTLKDQRLLTIDEKSALHWKGKHLNTFAFSISNYNSSGQWMRGWFMDDTQKSDTYSISWLDEDNDITTSIIKKSAIHKYLASLGWTYELLVKKESSIRNGDQNLGDLDKNGVRFSYLPQYPEKDVNLLLSRDLLISLSEVSIRSLNDKPQVLKSTFGIYL